MWGLHNGVRLNPMPHTFPGAANPAEMVGRTAGLTDESVCSTLLSKDFHPCGAGAFACQPFFSRVRLVRAGSPGPSRLGALSFPCVRTFISGNLKLNSGTIAERPAP
jgi:hypothetical protein